MSGKKELTNISIFVKYNNRMKHKLRNGVLINRPYTIEAIKAHRKKIVTYNKEGTARLHLGSQTKIIPPDHQFDLTQATIFGLNERLTLSATSPVIGKGGKTLRDKFNEEWELYAKTLEKAKGNVFDYGVYAYYAERNHLVRYCPPYWHSVVAIASNAKLISDPKNKYSWKEIRGIFEHTTIAIAGGSVGNNIMHGVIMDLRPQQVKIADKSLYKMENINRVRLNYWDIVRSNATRIQPADLLLRNKAEVMASQLYTIDPYLRVYVYNEGVHQGNIDNFLDGSGREARVDIIIEEVDDPNVKLLLRDEAKKRKIPLLMASDMGSCVQIDILRYDKNSKLPLTYGTKDAVLRKSTRAVYENPSDRDVFFKFVDDLIGIDYRQDELKKIIEGKTEIPTSTIIPQLGSTAAVAGGLLAETIARIRLGYNYPSRIIFNKRTFGVKIYR